MVKPFTSCAAAGIAADAARAAGCGSNRQHVKNTEVFMKIDSYAVQSSSKREYTKVAQVTTLLVQGELPAAEETLNAAENANAASQPANVAISEQGKIAVADRFDVDSAIEKLKEKILSSRQALYPKNPTELKINLLEQLLRAITGKKHIYANYSAFSLNTSSSISFQAFQGTVQAQGANRGTFMQTEAFVYEKESTSYQAQGIINTADGKTITVDVSLNMSREYSSYSVTQQQIKSVDPLVINYGGTAASLTGERFAFDLDVDGKMDMISSLGEGSGFLALDKNNDGVINDGSELFGPQSGSGFDDLRGYDSDGNGWIDENDDIFSKLRIWCKDAEGNDQLFTLLELDVGAIFLGDVETEFSINDGNNSTLGTVRSTSIFLKESGGAGTISHVDLAV